MRAVKKLNNNVVTCIDDDGNELIAMGRGLGFGALPREVALNEIDRTFYDVGSRYLGAVGDIPEDVLDFAAKVVDIARNQLPSELSSNLTFILADHIAYAIERARKHVYVKMPMSYDVEQTYPDEFKLGRFVAKRVEKKFNVTLPREEAAGIALNLVNARVAASDEPEGESRGDADMLEDITEIIEGEFGVVVDRESFAFSRYATHMLYLFGRLRSGEKLDAAGLDGAMLDAVRSQFPKGAACAEKISMHIAGAWGRELSDDERLYITLHIGRICS